MNLRIFRKALFERIKAHSNIGLRIVGWLQRVGEDYTNLQSLALWTAAVCTGIIAVMYANVFRLVEELYERYQLEVPLAVSLLSPVFFSLAWWVVYRYAPEASGSGIPQVMAAIETEYAGPGALFVNRILSIKTGAIKILSSLFCLAGGGAIGREGPTLQVSGAVFHFFGDKVRRIYPRANEQTWVIAGAAAGLASAFNTPLGGIVYAIEELGIHHFHKVRTALLTAVIISGLVAQGFLGSYLYLGFPRLRPISGTDWIFVVLIAFVSSMLGALFSRSLIWCARKRRSMKSAKNLFAMTLLTGAISGLLIYLVPSAHGTGSKLIAGILFQNEASDLITVFARLIATSSAYLSGAAGGIFSPSLTVGACIGSYLSLLVHSDQGNLLSMLGMIGFLTGVTHTPFTSFILVMEMSDRHSAVFPMMLTALLANSFAKSIQSKSFYETIRDDLLQSQASK